MSTRPSKASTLPSILLTRRLISSSIRMGGLFRRKPEQLAGPGCVGIGIAGSAVGEHIDCAVGSDLYVANACVHFGQQCFLGHDLVAADFQSVKSLSAQGATQQAVLPLGKH